MSNWVFVSSFDVRSFADIEMLWRW